MPDRPFALLPNRPFSASLTEGKETWAQAAKSVGASPTRFNRLVSCKAVTLIEANVLHTAASSLVYGIFEEMKGMDYSTLLPNGGDRRRASPGRAGWNTAAVLRGPRSRQPQPGRLASARLHGCDRR